MPVKKMKPAKVIKNITIPVKDGEGRINMSWASSDITDDDKKKVGHFFLWINGDYLVEYKAKRYIVSCHDVVEALIESIDAEEPDADIPGDFGTHQYHDIG